MDCGIRQVGGQKRFERSCGCRPARGEDDVGDEPFVVRRIFAHEHHGIGDGIVTLERCFDLTQFD